MLLLPQPLHRVNGFGARFGVEFRVDGAGAYGGVLQQVDDDVRNVIRILARCVGQFGVVSLVLN